MAEIDWDKGLPLDVLANVAGGSDLLKAMRGVSKTWKKGYELSVTVIQIWDEGPPPPPTEIFSERFPSIGGLGLGKAPMSEDNLGCLRVKPPTLKRNI